MATVHIGGLISVIFLSMSGAASGSVLEDGGSSCARASSAEQSSDAGKLMRTCFARRIHVLGCFG